MEEQPFDLNELLNSVTAGLQVQAGTKGLALITRMTGDPQPGVRGDALRLRQVLTNLVNNGKGRVIIEFSVPARALIGYRDEFLKMVGRAKQICGE